MSEDVKKEEKAETPKSDKNGFKEFKYSIGTSGDEKFHFLLPQGMPLPVAVDAAFSIGKSLMTNVIRADMENASAKKADNSKEEKSEK